MRPGDPARGPHPGAPGPPSVPRLQGERVVVRPMTESDIEAVAAIFAHPEIAAIWPGETADTLRALRDEPDGAALVVELADRVIGFAYYEDHRADPNYRHGSLDIVLDPPRCGQGLGTDALRTLARHLFSPAGGQHRLTIDPRADNARAIASYRKVGFRPVGVMRRYERGVDGEWHDGLLMDLLPDDLAAG